MSEPIPHQPQAAAAPAGHDAIRASDQDRQLVADVLTSAYADGRITRDELDERLASTWQARTFGELTPITADLQGALSAPTTQYATSPTSTGVAVVPAAATDAVTRHVAVLSTRRRAGEPLAQRTQARSVLGDVILDLTASTFAARECEVEVRCVLGDVRIYVPAGVTVVDRTRTVLGDSKVTGVQPSPDGPTLVLTGSVVLGDLSVHGPDDLRARVKRMWKGA